MDSNDVFVLNPFQQLHLDSIERILFGGLNQPELLTKITHKGHSDQTRNMHVP